MKNKYLCACLKLNIFINVYDKWSLRIFTFIIFFIGAVGNFFMVGECGRKGGLCKSSLPENKIWTKIWIIPNLIFVIRFFWRYCQEKELCYIRPHVPVDIIRGFFIPDTAQKMKSPIKDFFSKCDQLRSLLRICSHLLKKSLMENFIFSAVKFSTH